MNERIENSAQAPLVPLDFAGEVYRVTLGGPDLPALPCITVDLYGVWGPAFDGTAWEENRLYFWLTDARRDTYYRAYQLARWLLRKWEIAGCPNLEVFWPVIAAALEGENGIEPRFYTWSFPHAA